MNVRDHERERRIVEMHLRDGMTFEDIGKLEGVTRERIRQIVRRCGVTVEQTRAAMEAAAMVTLRCDGCGAEFQRRDSMVRATRVFCSRPCMQDWHARRLAGMAYTEAELVEHMRALAARLGRTPGEADLNGNEGPCHTTYCAHFGTLRDAQRAAGLTPRSRGNPGHTDQLERSA